MSEAADVECLVVGAGVIGLAIARALAKAGREVVILEAEHHIGTGISSRNSGVIHAGIYYSSDSLKARFCVAGRKALYAYCKAQKIPHQVCGKIIVAASEMQSRRLMAIKARAEANGVLDLVALDRTELLAAEPELQGQTGLLSPSTGIIDVRALMLAFQSEFEACGGVVAFDTPVTRGEVQTRKIMIQTGGADPMRLAARWVILAAGLSTPKLARSIDGVPPASIPKAYFAKGNYFSLAGQVPFCRLIYPLPEPGGLGAHLTLDMAGRGRFGPDVEWLDLTDDARIDYSVDESRVAAFYKSIRLFWPGLKEGALAPDYSGVRPKLVGPREQDSDFLIQDSKIHGASGLIALYGIESPGLTASLAIADYVASALDDV
ncbi:MAG: NAD(P)/FAD-dependent oxidoreductase [Methylocella sp.]